MILLIIEASESQKVVITHLATGIDSQVTYHAAAMETRIQWNCTVSPALVKD